MSINSHSGAKNWLYEPEMVSMEDLIFSEPIASTSLAVQAIYLR